MAVPDAVSAALPLEQLARRAGAYCWLEGRLFETLGGWVAAVNEPEAKLALATHAREHAWHAELWQERLPSAGDLAPEQLVAPANDQVGAFAAAVAEPEGEDQTIEKLVGAYRVLLPRMVTAYSEHLRVTTEVADGPVVRALRLVLRDELEEWARGETLVQSLLRTEEDVRRAAGHQARLESMLTYAALVPPVTGRQSVTGHLDSGATV